MKEQGRRKEQAQSDKPTIAGSNIVAFPHKSNAAQSVDFNGKIILMVSYSIDLQTTENQVLFAKTFTGDSATNLLTISHAVAGVRNICHRYPGNTLRIEGWIMTKDVLGTASVFKAIIAAESIEELAGHLNSFKDAQLKAVNC